MRNLPLRPLGFGEIVDGAFQIYRRDFWLLYLIVLLGDFPGYLLNLAWPVPDSDLVGLNAAVEAQDPDALAEAVGALVPGVVRGLVVGLTMVAFWFLGGVAAAAAIVERIEDRPAPLGRAYRLAVRHLPRAGGATIVSLLILGVVFLVGAMFGGAVLAVAEAASLGAVPELILTILLGLAAAVVFAFWMGATFGILPAVIVEGRKAMSALGRSVRLCRGAWLRVVGVMLVALIIMLVPGFALEGLDWLGGLFTSPEARGLEAGGWQWLEGAVGLIASPLFEPFAIAAVMVLFHDRRVRTEAYDLETLAESVEAS